MRRDSKTLRQDKYKVKEARRGMQDRGAKTDEDERMNHDKVVYIFHRRLKKKFRL